MDLHGRGDRVASAVASRGGGASGKQILAEHVPSEKTIISVFVRGRTNTSYATPASYETYFGKLVRMKSEHAG
jgi:hypothetical protein